MIQLRFQILPDPMRLHRLFYLAFAILCATPVLVGFMPTFFARKMFIPADGHGPDGLPILLIIHGVFMTAWVLLVAVQAALVVAKKITVHRRLGWLTVAIGLGSWITAALVVPSFAPRLLALGLPAEILREALAKMYWTDIFSLVVFPLFVLSGVLLRRKPEFHKRIMIYSTLTLLSPAVGRMTRMIAPGEAFGGINWTLSIAILTGLSLLPIVHELFRYRKVHRASIGSAAVVLACNMAIIGISSTDWGKDVSVLHLN